MVQMTARFETVTVHSCDPFDSTLCRICKLYQMFVLSIDGVD